MNEKVNYEDTLFYISMKIKNIQKSFLLNISPAYFAERQAEDILFIFHTLQKVLRELADNKFLINRNQYLNSLVRVLMQFTELIRSYLKEEQKELVDKSILRQIMKIQEMVQNDLSDIRDILNQNEQTEVEKDLISNEELNFLMAPGLINDDETTEF